MLKTRQKSQKTPISEFQIRNWIEEPDFILVLFCSDKPLGSLGLFEQRSQFSVFKLNLEDFETWRLQHIWQTLARNPVDCFLRVSIQPREEIENWRQYQSQYLICTYCIFGGNHSVNLLHRWTLAPGYFWKSRLFYSTGTKRSHLRGDNRELFWNTKISVKQKKRLQW